MNTKNSIDETKEIKFLNKKRNLIDNNIEKSIDTKLQSSKSSLFHPKDTKKQSNQTIVHDSVDYEKLINDAFDHFLKGENDKFLIIHEKLEKYQKTKANNIKSSVTI